MNDSRPISSSRSVPLSRAALIAGFGLLVMVFAAPTAEFVLLPRVLVHGDIAETVRRIAADRAAFLGATFGYLVTALADVVVAWALYVLLAPTNRALALLAAWLRLTYAVLFFAAGFKLLTAFRLATASAHPSDTQLAQIDFLIHEFGYEWSSALLLFALYLCLLGYLVFRSGYIPRVMGVLLVVSGLGYLVDGLQPYLYPNTDMSIVYVTFFGELIFMAWLLIRGGFIREPASSGESRA